MKDIEQLASYLTSRYGTSSPFELCDYLHVDVCCLDLPDRVRGLSVQKKPEGSVILLNREMDDRESRYCCAHELGHVLLHPGLNAQAMQDLTNLCVPRFEREADFFAGCLFIGPSIKEWCCSYSPLTSQQIACLSGLPHSVAELWCENQSMTPRKTHTGSRTKQSR